MHKDSTTQAKQKKDEREEVLKEIRQLENRQKILENKQRNEERKARTRRLIERGAILEGIFPLAPDLPGVEVKAFLIALSHLPGAAELAAKLPVSPLFTRAHLYTVSGAVRPAGGVAYFVRDGKGGWKNHREDTTDWNDKGNVEIWRVAWAAYTNRALESAGRPERIDHRSYKRQGIDKIPSVHLGPAASQMEKRGIRTDKGEVNRQIAADNKLLKEIKARITRLYNWSKAEAEKPEGQQPSMIDLWEAQQQLKRPDTRTGKIRALQESAALFSFLQANGIQSMQQLHEKIADMNTRYYDLRREIVKAERRIATLTERGEMWAQYNKYKPIRKQLAKVKKYGAVVQASKYMSATTVEYINGIEVIKAFNQSAASYGKFTQAVRQSVDLMLDWMKSTQGYSALMMTIWPAVLIGVLPVGCLFYMKASAVPERAKHGPLPSGMAPRLPIFCISRSIVEMF